MPETVSDSTKGVLGCCVLTHVASCDLACTRVHENDLPTAGSQHGEQQLRQEVWCTDIDTILPIEVLDQSGLERAQRDAAGTVDQEIEVANVLPNARRQVEDLLVAYQVCLDATNVWCRSSSDVCNCFQLLAAPPY